jgi:hypothetical protein
VLPHRPIEFLPRQPFVLAAMDIPGDHADQARIRLRLRTRPARARRRENDQSEPAR